MSEPQSRMTRDESERLREWVRANEVWLYGWGCDYATAAGEAQSDGLKFATQERVARATRHPRVPGERGGPGGYRGRTRRLRTENVAYYPHEWAMLQKDLEQQLSVHEKAWMDSMGHKGAHLYHLVREIRSVTKRDWPVQAVAEAIKVTGGWEVTGDWRDARRCMVVKKDEAQAAAPRGGVPNG